MSPHNNKVNLKPLFEYFFNGENSVENTIKMMEEDKDFFSKTFTRKEEKKDNNWTIGKFKEFSFAANSITGFRLDQEDRYTCLESPKFTKDWNYFGVYDGHGGAIVAEYLKRKLHEHILEQFEKLGDIEAALNQGFQACDQAIRTMKEDEFNEIKDATMKEFTGSDYQPLTSGCKMHFSGELYNEIKNQFLNRMLEMQTDLNKPSTSTTPEKDCAETEKNDEPKVRRSKRFKKEKTAGSTSHSEETVRKKAKPEKKVEDEEIPLVGLCMGSTATAVIFTDEMLYVASVGDSTCAAYKEGNRWLLTSNHTPNAKQEKQRILESGHNVRNNRVDGVLNMSRAFGDFTFKDKKNMSQTEQAVISEPSIKSIPIKDVDFVIIASDGVWNGMNYNSLIDFVALGFSLSLEEMISEAFQRVIFNEGLDNLTLIVIKNDEKCALYPSLIEQETKENSKQFQLALEKLNQERYKRMQSEKTEQKNLK